jgi:hypothetical protein
MNLLRQLLLLVPLVTIACPLAGQTPAPLREDLAWFRREVFLREKSYTPAARAEAERRLAALEATIDKIKPLAFEVEIARIVGLADNGHSSANSTARAGRANRVPIRLATFGDEFRVMRADKSLAELLGAKLTAVDGRPISTVRDAARTLWGGTSAWRDRGVPLVLESPAQMQVLGVAADESAAEYSFVTLDGKTVSKRLVAEKADGAAAEWPPLLVYGRNAFPTVDARWAVLEPPSMPWSLAEPATTFRWRAAPEIDGMVIQLRRISDVPGQAIGEFLTSMTEKLRADKPRNLALDMRMNTGGNLDLARDFMKQLPGLVPGRIFVITNPSTFSAAIASIGYLKQAAPDRVTIVGEEVGDRLVFFAEGGPMTSPNLGMEISSASRRHDYQNGCATWTDCHLSVVQFPIAVRTLRPDIPAPLTFSAWMAGRDPAMEAIARVMRQ